MLKFTSISVTKIKQGYIISGETTEINSETEKPVRFTVNIIKSKKEVLKKIEEFLI